MDVTTATRSRRNSVNNNTMDTQDAPGTTAQPKRVAAKKTRPAKKTKRAK
jgi:hypothetical protein